MDFSQVLLEKSGTIVDRWVNAVCEDEQIEATQELSYSAIRDSLPLVLGAMATVLSQSETSDLRTLVDASLEHGVLRAGQGFEPAEIAREYRLLRSTIFSVLEADLLRGTPGEMLRTVRLIDTVIDEAIARCFNSYTEGRLRELEELQNQLKLTNQELTRLVRASKDNFSELAHELKTPLTSIIGYSDLFLRQQRQDAPKDSAQNLEHIERVLRNGRQLLHLINDALEISRFEAGRMKLQLVETDVRGLIRTTLEIVEPLARSKSLTIALSDTLAPDRILTDPLRLQQILTNLLSNAVRYTHPGGQIHLTVQVLSEQSWAIEVSDSGIGIDAEAQTHVFDPYFRASEQAPVPESTGLGLAIVARLVKLLKGSIKLDSQLGKGSIFTVVLPLLPATRPSPEATIDLASTDSLE